MLEAFQSFIDEELPILKNGRLLVAVSGGIDSVVLTHLCTLSNMETALAHCNFKLRGDDSEKDEAFVVALGEQLGLEVFVQEFDTESYMNENLVSLQMAARELRYQWFKDLAQQLNFDYILTAHHADDNLETFLINFSRGTGLNGLTGIPIWNDNIVRPLLPFSQVEIHQLALENNWKWREDNSNSSRKYLRNKLRHEVVPILKEINPNLLSSFRDTMSNLNDTADIVEESLNAVAKRAITHIDSKEVHYKVSEFKKVSNAKAYLHEMFKSFGFTEWYDVVDLLDAQSGKYVKSTTHRLIKHRDVLILTDLHPPKYEEYEIQEEDLKLNFPKGRLTFEVPNSIGTTSANAVYLNKEVLIFPLKLRIWEAGDYFIPIGMNGKKKVSKYLKDEKISTTEKERTWVLCSGNDIIWVVGKRADERFKVKKSNTQIMKIQYHKEL
ncbi:MAG: tRNA lysidine(34) synthetase TilS [Bacteroidota bacterium]